MLRRIVAVVILILIALVVCLALGVVNPGSILPPGLATDLGLPTMSAFSLPSTLAAIGEDLTNESQPETVPIYTGSLETMTPAPAMTPTPLPIQNGRILYLGVDEKVYSIDPVSKSVLLLGEATDFHIFPGQAWHSPDGRYALVVRVDGEGEVVYAASVDGSSPDLIVGELSTGENTNLPRNRYEFSGDSSRMWYINSRDGSPFIHVIDLPGGLTRSMSLSFSRGSYNLAAFMGNGEFLLMASEGSTAFEGVLSVFRVMPDNLVLERELIRFSERHINQVSVSLDGKWIAVVLEDPAGAQSLILMDSAGQVNGPILQGSGTRFLLQPPAWTKNSRYFLVNRWQQEQAPAYSILSYDTQHGVLATLLEENEGSLEGNPLGAVSSFAPDGNAVGILEYNSVADSVNYWISVLDGSYLRLAGKSEMVDKLPQGDFVAGIATDWTKMVIVQPEPGLPVGNLYVAALDGSQRILLDGPVPYRFSALGPVISPDGLQAAYMRLEISVGNEVAELCIIGLDGQGKTVLLGGATLEGHGIPGIPLVWLPFFPR